MFDSRHISLFPLAQVLKVLRILKARKAQELIALSGMSDQVRSQGAKTQVFNLVFILLSCIFIAAGIVFSLETLDTDSFSLSSCDDHNVDDYLGSCIKWHDALYFVVVTFTTVGYGDVVPVSWQARLMMLMMLGASAFLSSCVLSE